jgi:hypothetical protein
MIYAEMHKYFNVNISDNAASTLIAITLCDSVPITEMWHRNIPPLVIYLDYKWLLSLLKHYHSIHTMKLRKTMKSQSGS